MQTGPTEVNAALEFAVNTLLVSICFCLQSARQDLSSLIDKNTVRFVLVVNERQLFLIGWEHLSNWPQLLRGYTRPYGHGRWWHYRVLNSSHSCSFSIFSKCVLYIRFSLEYFHFLCSFIKSWVVNAKNAKVKTKAVTSNLDFDDQCKHCEKVIFYVLRFECVIWMLKVSKKVDYVEYFYVLQVSINHTLVNLLSYPWIKEKVEKEELSIHGGYYDFTDCSFEKWTLDYRGTKLEANGRIATKDKVFWSWVFTSVFLIDVPVCVSKIHTYRISKA